MNPFFTLKLYRLELAGLIILTFLTNSLNIFLPLMIASHIDRNDTNYVTLSIVIVSIFFFGGIQTYYSSKLTEQYARDTRTNIINKLARLKFSQLSEYNSATLYTNFTSDVDSTKQLISTGIINTLSALILLIGSLIMLFRIDWQLALMAMATLPVIGFAFGSIFSKVSKFFKLAQENLVKINKIINESIVASPLVRVLNSQAWEEKKFSIANTTAQNIGENILNAFATLLPIVNVISNMTVLVIIWLGGTKYMDGKLTVGEISAFLNYYNLLITPIFLLGFVGNIISRSQISQKRIDEFLNLPERSETASKSKKDIVGKIEFIDVCLSFGDRQVLQNISFVIEAGTKNALVGPVAAGKSQIMYLLAGLIEPTSGKILIDGVSIQLIDRNLLRKYMGIVFQDNLLFNGSIKQNIVFDGDFSDIDMQKAIQTAQLNEFMNSLPNTLETIVSERGSNLSGGQKQRIMLARSLVLNPKILLLDDFTARVDIKTEQQILSEITKNYPSLTLFSITQKITSVVDYDQIILVMEGEILGSGNHKNLLSTSSEYRQIWESQQTIHEINTETI